MIRKSILFGVSLLFVFTCSSAFSQEGNLQAEITVNAGKVIAELKPYVINGFNVNNSMQILTIRDRVARLGTVTLTTPAGELGDTQYLSEKDLDFFKTQQTYIGNPHTFMQVRLAGGTIEAAVKQVKYCKEIGIRVDVWTIGNEPTLYGQKFGDNSWTIEKYCTVFRDYVNAMKKADPNLKFAGPVPNQPDDGWIRKFITECGDIVDVLAWHWYPTDGKTGAAGSLATAKDAKAMIRRYQSWLKDPKINPRGYKRQIGTAVTEWAIHWDTVNNKLLTDMAGVLWSAEVIGCFVEAGLDYSHYFCLNQYGGHALFNKINKPRLLYYLFVMFKEHFGQKMIESGSSINPVRTIATLKSEKSVSVFLINQSPDKAVDAAVKVEGMRASASVGVSVEAYELSDEVRYEKMADDLVRKAKTGVSVTLKPYSVTLLVLTYGNP
jgi:hypothetical protein